MLRAHRRAAHSDDFRQLYKRCHEIIALYYAILIALSSTKYDVRKQFVSIL